MTWKPRTCGENLYHHIYAWGNNRHDVFKKVYHYRKYRELLKKYSQEYEVDILAYALMQWHVHLFIHDHRNNISQFMFSLHGDYAQYVNKDTRRIGHVFGERFNNKIVQVNVYGIWLSRYIHRQPLEAGLVDDPKDYPWTSYRKYLGLEKKDFIKNDIIMEQLGNGNDLGAVQRYQEFVMDEDNGPVDWRSKKINLTIEQTILNKAISESGISGRVLLSPQGATERLRRQTVIVELTQKYGFGVRQMAKAFNVAPSTIARLLKKDDSGDTD